MDAPTILLELRGVLINDAGLIPRFRWLLELLESIVERSTTHRLIQRIIAIAHNFQMVVSAFIYLLSGDSPGCYLID